MKRIIALLLSLVLVLASCMILTACGDKTSNFKVGAVYIGSQNDTAGYTFAHHDGIVKAMQQLGLSVKDDLKIADNVAEDYTEVSNAIDNLAGQGCNIIFGISFGYINAFDDAAKKDEYKDIIFSHATGYLSNEDNFNNYFGRIYQARYLSGVAAGLKSLEVGNNNLGYVAAWGTEYAETCSGINAFALGAQSVNPDAVVHVKKISTWGDESLERQAAEILFDTYNCCVIAQHCDSAQPQLVADEKGMFGCGYNTDMTSQAPDAHLTAPIWHWDVYYKLAIETAMNNPENFMTDVGIYYGGLKEKFVDISPLSKNCTSDTAAKVAAVKALIESGDWDVFSNVKLSFDANGNIVKTTAALLDNKGNTVITEDGSKLYVHTTDGPLSEVTTGTDSLIKGSMNYYVAGVTEE